MTTGHCAITLRSTSISAVIDREYSLSQGPEAIASIAEGNHFGKLLVRIG